MFNLSFKRDQKQLLSNHFQQRTSEHWKKKIPKDKGYAFTVHDPFEIFGERSGFENFYLVGDNWIEAKDKPIAIAIGFNDWKFGFIADYLPEFRVAFAPRRLNNYKLIWPLKKLVEQPTVAVVWGYNESKIIRKYLNYSNIDIWRAEDGFIRSADLGANGATPYSLVFDKSGLYYNSGEPSDIEKILNNYSFDNKVALKKQAQFVLKLILELKVSKYNPPIIYTDKNLKFKKRILVVGQVDNDASIRYGNPDGWTMEDVVRLAKYENPECEILYRPHPEISKGFQNSNFDKSNVEYFAKVISPDEHIIDLIERVDHVYTITSLTGLEALLRGKKVTVLGQPFYAGWGLTDDRSVFREGSRLRQLELWQLFAASYLVYPRYLNDITDVSKIDQDAVSTSSIVAILGRIQSEKKILINKLITNKEVKTNKPDIELASALYNKDIKLLSFRGLQYSIGVDNSYFQELLSLIVLSIAKNDTERSELLVQIRAIINVELFNKILLFMEDYQFGPYLVDHWNWLLTESQDYITAKNYFSESNGFRKEVIESINMTPSVNKNLFIVNMTSKNFNEAKTALKALVITRGSDIRDVLVKAINVSASCFDFQSVNKFSTLLMNIDVHYANRFSVLQRLKCSIHSQDDFYDILEISFDLATYKPDLLSQTDFLIGNLEDVSLEKVTQNALVQSLKLGNEVSARKVNGLIAAEMFEEAEKLATKLIASRLGSHPERDVIAYSIALSYNNKLQEATKVIEQFIVSRGISRLLAHEAMRLYILTGEYDKSLALLNKCILLNIEISEMHRRKLFFGNRFVGEALETFKQLRQVEHLEVYFGKKFVNDLGLIRNRGSAFLISLFGPGDEIRFATIYRKIRDLFPELELYIACEPRLKNIMENSFPTISFVSVHRTRNGDKILTDNYTLVPGADLSVMIDNNAMNIINKVDCITLVTSMLSDIFPNYDSFFSSSFLICDDVLKQSLRVRLPNEKILIGISWRSSLTGSTRNMHYLTIEELKPLFEIENVQFVNMQYDDSSDEVAWVNKYYPGKLLDLEDIDQYNDFDSVAALMCCMDLVISPVTTVAELAGALGVRTWLFSNSSELDWRKTNNSGIDVWHNSITIVDVPNKGDKKALVNELYNRLVKFVED